MNLFSSRKEAQTINWAFKTAPNDLICQYGNIYIMSHLETLIPNMYCTKKFYFGENDSQVWAHGRILWSNGQIYKN